MSGSGNMKRRPNRALAKRQLNNELLDKVIPTCKPLAMVHVTSLGVALEVFGTGTISPPQLSTQDCRVFGQKLVYFFVARPAYRLGHGGEKSDQVARFPMVFIMRPDALPKPFQVYPFDTGAAMSSIYGEATNTARNQVYLEDHELEPDLEATRRLIEWAFGTAEDYFEGRLRPNLDTTIDASFTRAKVYLDVARSAAPGENRPDARASSIEVAYKDNISLDHLAAVILPLNLLHGRSREVTDMLAWLSNRLVKLKFYDWKPNLAPDDFLDEINKLTRQHLVEEGQLQP